MLEAAAPAKINLTLSVGPRRADGYHEIESLVVQLSLADTVRVTPRDDAQIRLSADATAVPTDETNLAVRAARQLAENRGGDRPGADIVLTKRIPIGAGLGGGSSDAATTLMLLNRAWALDRPLDELHAIGAQIGSDVPLFLHRGPCVIRGRGEQVEPIDLRLPPFGVLLLPGIECATAAVYGAFDQLAAEKSAAPDVESLIAIGSDADAWLEVAGNDLESAALAAHPELVAFVASARELCSQRLVMSGSGSTFFTLCDTRDEADDCVAVLQTLSALPTTDRVPPSDAAPRVEVVTLQQ